MNRNEIEAYGLDPDAVYYSGRERHALQINIAASYDDQIVMQLHGTDSDYCRVSTREAYGLPRIDIETMEVVFNNHSRPGEYTAGLRRAYEPLPTSHQPVVPEVEPQGNHFRRFTRTDWYGWAGAERFDDGSEPFIAEVGRATFILDKTGLTLNWVTADYEDVGAALVDPACYVYEAAAGGLAEQLAVAEQIVDALVHTEAE